MKFKLIFVLPIIALIAIIACEKDRGINLFTKSQDVEFGLQMKEHIQSSGEFTVLSRTDYPEAYAHLDRIMNTILDNAGDIKNGRDVFMWESYIIDQDVLNAFACPGGFMYFYTGLIDYLENEAEFAGIMAHEMAHVELRHSTRKMTDYYGYATLIDILFGKEESKMDTIIQNMVTGLTTLAFSRKFESQADEYAVKFLTDTDYDPRGMAGFFEKMDAEGKSSGFVPVILRTHPTDDKRIKEIYELWEDQGSPTGQFYEERYNDFKNSLP
jgi:beta-barrel assembly-enhancing protease